MNKITLIGNLTRDPESRTVAGINGDSVCCSFTIAVNSRRNRTSGQDDAMFFRINAWNRTGENCQKYLAKGRKVCVIGELSAHTYQASDGTTRVSLDVRAEDIEFLTSRAEAEGGYNATAPSEPAAAPAPTAQNNGFTAVEEDDLPF